MCSLPIELTSYQLLESIKTTALNVGEIHAHF